MDMTQDLHRSNTPRHPTSLQSTMIIPIRSPENGESTDQVEWVMIELNGELLRPLDETKSSATKSALPMSADEMKRRVELGSIKFDSDGAPTLIMGNHQLKGTANKLKEPFAVLRKRKAHEVTNSTDNGDTDSESKLKKTSGVQLQVVGVVKKKLMFAQYPKSIMR